MQSDFVVVDEYRSGDMHGVHQTKTFSHTAPLNQFINFWCDVDEPASIRHFEPKMFCERFQWPGLGVKVNDKMYGPARE